VLTLFTVLAFVAGSAIGFVAAFLAARNRIERARAQAMAEAETTRAVLEERLRSNDGLVAEARSQIAAQQNELRQRMEQLQAETGRRSTAEAQATRVPELEASLAALRLSNTELGQLRSELETRIAEERKASEEKAAILQEAQAKLSDAFKALSSEALNSNNKAFLELAKTHLEKFQEGAKTDLETRQKAVEELVKPVKESLVSMDTKLQELETKRVSAYSELLTQVGFMKEQQTLLKTETSKLVQALRTPNVRGKWGEIQLRRVVEMAGMLNYCDFEEQVSSKEGEFRPDMIVRLPGGRNIVVDAKTPILAYLDALEADDEDKRKEHLARQAQHVRDHIKKLSAKSYWDQFANTPEFVVLFLPAESLFAVALEQDKTLIEEGVNQKVIPASPITLIALLRAVSYGWRQEDVAKSAEEIAALGKELYERIGTMAEHLDTLGKRLQSAVDSYNRAVGSFESRVLVSARRFKELKAAAGGEIEEIEQLDITPRAVDIPDFSSTPKLLPDDAEQES
jgi:DNA recombination protein RmuC